MGLLSLSPEGGWGFSPGALLILLACLMWGLDNNLTRHIFLRDPKAIVATKGLLAGIFSLGLAALRGMELPALGYVLLAVALGAVSYGFSILLFVQALREIGAARTGALFSLAPFLAAALSLLIFRQPPEGSFFLALPLLALGAYLLLSEHHQHQHVHAPLVHDHLHRHDDGHHDHPHPEGAKTPLLHSHPHAHRKVVHSHPHSPDIHHRHLHRATLEAEGGVDAN